MSHSVLASFDPLAVHPFTNTSGLMPKPMAPSQYPHPLPSSATLSSPPASPAQGFIHTPQPSRTVSPKKSLAASKGPIFVPFRPDRSSPELDDILLRKRVSDVLVNKQPQWSIDHQTSVPVAVRRS